MAQGENVDVGTPSDGTISAAKLSSTFYAENPKTYSDITISSASNGHGRWANNHYWYINNSFGINIYGSIVSEILANKLSPSTGTSVQLGDSGDTFNIPAGVTLTNSGTMNASAITAGTLPIARGGTGSSSTTFVNAATNITGNYP